MIDVEELQEMRRDRLVVGILRFVRKARQGFTYAVQARGNFPWATDAEFAECVEQLVAKNLITETKGRDGGVQLRPVQQKKENTGGN